MAVHNNKEAINQDINSVVFIEQQKNILNERIRNYRW
jgi:hypothetical protein